jgi:hypothetical protein
VRPTFTFAAAAGRFPPTVSKCSTQQER